ncbi:MAG: hypothetical protein JXR40_06030 [Pontiellaceae bacterium]|nr:hypothetical protein [Pontiellaceae bacterium]
MKRNNIGYIFVDDGYPEAEDYETNYVGYDMQVPGSYNRAAHTASNMLPTSRISDTIAFRTVPLKPYKNRIKKAKRKARSKILRSWLNFST